MQGYLSGDVYGTLVTKGEGWRLTTAFGAADKAWVHVRNKPHLFYRLEKE